MESAIFDTTFVNFGWGLVSLELCAYCWIFREILVKRDRKFHLWYLIPLIGILLAGGAAFTQWLIKIEVAVESTRAIPNYVSDQIQDLIFYDKYLIGSAFVVLILTVIVFLFTKPKTGRKTNHAPQL